MNLKRTLISLGILGVAIGLAAAIIGCAGPVGLQNATGKGTLVLSLGPFHSANSKDILPPGDMACAQFSISGTGPQSNTFGPTIVASGSANVGNLVPGTWQITVLGENAAGTAIGAGSGTAEVTMAQTTNLAITVTEYAGNGSFQLSLSWQPNIVASPLWVGSLTSQGSTTIPQTFVTDLASCTSTSFTPNLPAGWYAEVAALYNSPDGLTTSSQDILSSGFAQAVRIAQGQQTTGTIAVHAVQGVGSISISITPSFNDPLTLTPNVPFGATNIYSAPQTFSATTTTGAVFFYYLQGQLVSAPGATSYSLNPAGLIMGETYRLDVLAFSANGQNGGDGTWIITRTPGSPNEIIGTITDAGAPAQIEVQLFDKAGYLNNIVQYATGHGGAYQFDFANIPAGNWYVYYDYPGMTGAYFTSSGPVPTRGQAQAIAIPNAGGAFLANF